MTWAGTGAGALLTAAFIAVTTAGSAHRILDERLSRGEISPGEHAQRRAVLGAASTHPQLGRAAPLLALLLTDSLLAAWAEAAAAASAPTASGSTSAHQRLQRLCRRLDRGEPV
jgi:hypothetical protein